MAITLQGVRVNDIQLKPNEAGVFSIEGAEYSLISSTGKVLAKQTIGGYKGMAIEPSDTTKAAMKAFTDSYAADVQNILGLLE